MAYCEYRLILASGSPRRRELLGKFGLPFEVIPAVGEEESAGSLSPGEYVKRLAAEKAREVYERVGDERAVLIAADTIVELGGEILGKPKDRLDACRMLSMLSGNEHRVWSGVCVRQGQKVLTDNECTAVHFRPLSGDEIAAYADTGEPLDKAGAYGYQGIAGLFVDRISGDYFNVVGLPICRLGQMLAQLGVKLL